MPNINFEKALKFGVNLTSEHIVVLEYIESLFLDKSTVPIRVAGINHKPVDRELFYRRYPFFKDSRSTQWFGALLRFLCNEGILHRLEESNKYGFDKIYYRITGAKSDDDILKKQSKSKAELEHRIMLWMADGNMDKHPEKMIEDFIGYWSEPILNDKAHRLRWEAQEAFGIGRRLATWAKNNFGESGGLQFESPKVGRRS